MSTKAEKSQKVLDTLRQSIDSFRNLLLAVNDEQTEQNILRSMILFSCSGIDAIVKQLILETLEAVIERDEGAQGQLRTFTKRKLKSQNEINYSLLAELLTVKDSRKWLIGMLKEELSYDSLQSADQLFKVAAYFNISTDKLINNDNKDVLKEAFHTRNIIVHQMDMDLEQNYLYSHTLAEVNTLFATIEAVAQNFITEVNSILARPKTKEYAPFFSLDDGVLTI